MMTSHDDTIDDTLTGLSHSTPDATDPVHKVYIGSKGLSKGACDRLLIPYGEIGTSYDLTDEVS